MNGWWREVVATAGREFSDFSDASSLTQIVIRLGVAVVLGGVLGFEREMAGRDAGLRTHMLVATGSALFVLVPLHAGFSQSDMSRVLQGLVSGIGFLGAGAIIKLSAEREVRGLTTAASLWLTAGVGIAAGLGREITALLSTSIALVILMAARHFGGKAALRRSRAAQNSKAQSPGNGGERGAKDARSHDATGE